MALPRRRPGGGQGRQQPATHPVESSQQKPDDEGHDDDDDNNNNKNVNDDNNNNDDDDEALTANVDNFGFGHVDNFDHGGDGGGGGGGIVSENSAPKKKKKTKMTLAKTKRSKEKKEEARATKRSTNEQSPPLLPTTSRRSSRRRTKTKRLVVADEDGDYSEAEEENKDDTTDAMAQGITDVVTAILPQHDSSIAAIEKELMDEEQKKEDDDDHDNDSNPPQFTEQKTRKTATGKQAAIRKRKRSRQEDGDCNNNDVEDEDDKEATANKKQKKKKLPCPFCGKVFYAKKGLSYHVNHFVCRQDERPGGPIIRGKKRKEPPQPPLPEEEGTGDGSVTVATTAPLVPQKTYQRVRGKAKDRTCQRCQRVFTSVLGLTYHMEKRVCVKAENNELPFPTLEPGTMFVTRFGVVQVVRDNRAKPTASFPDNMKQLVRLYSGFKQKREIQIQRMKSQQHAMHLLRRKRLNRLFLNGSINQDTVFLTCNGFRPKLDGTKAGDATSVGQSAEKQQQKRMPGPWPERPDPAVPQDSFPDRIVECIVVSDPRKRYVGIECIPALTENQTTTAASKLTTTRLFLQRRLLTQMYNPDTEVFICPTCGHGYESRSGLTHHIKSESCLRRAVERKAKRVEWLDSIESRATRFLHKGVRKAPPPPPPAVVTLDELPRRRNSSGGSSGGGDGGADLGELEKQVPRLDPPDYGVAPLVLVAAELGVDNNDDANALLGLRPAMTQREVKQIPKADDKFVDPRITFRKFKDELKVLESQMIGPMYPAVFQALKFKKAVRPKKKVVKKKTMVKKQKKFIPPTKTVAVVVKKGKKKTAVIDAVRPPETSAAASLATRPDTLAIETNRDELGPEPSHVTYAIGTTAGTTLHAQNDEVPDAAAAAAGAESNLVTSEATDPSKPPAIIDVRALVVEVCSGRYPTIQQNCDSVKHREKCPICKNGPRNGVALLECAFCTNAFHFDCLLTRWTVKDPEPGEPIMCHNCIGIILSRRTRAEKRRLEKLGFVTDDAIAAVLEKRQSVIRERKELVEGKEYECVLEQSRQLADLVEMLREAKIRLEQAMHTSKANEVRRAAIQNL